MRKRNYVKTEQRSRRSRRKKVILAAGTVFLCYFLFSFVFGEMGLVKYYRMKAHYNALNEEIARLTQDNVRLEKEVYALRSDPVYLERLARDKLGLARHGEIVYYYDEP
jgi:cell division protein FtsB